MQDELKNIFDENFAERGELGASLSVWKNGEEIVSLANGWKDRNKTQPWTADTPVLVWSATKGPAAACVLHACQQRGVTPEIRVAEYWPEFGAHGKDAMTVAQVMSHQAGVPVLDVAVPATDHAAVAAAIAAQKPFWEPAAAHGYHVRTYGFLMDEIVRRLSGISLKEYWRREFGDPMELDFWIGAPVEVAERASSVFPPKNAPLPDDEFYKAFGTPSSLTFRAFASPKGFGSVASMNTLEARQTSLPASGGIGTAQALAKFYMMLAGGGVWAGRRYFEQATLQWMEQPRVQNEDRILLTATSFACGFMKDPVAANGQKLRSIFGSSTGAFGHPGAGGSLAFADPVNKIAFAYVMNQMEPGVFPNQKSLQLVAELYSKV